MTNEVAIKAIQDFIGWFKEDSLIRKALEMAIKALENHDTFMKYSYEQGKKDALSQEPTSRVKNELKVELNELKPCDDVISRDAVLNAICDYVAFEEYEDKSHTFTIRPLTKRIKQLPSVTQKSGKWIPVRKRLPEDKTYVLTTIKVPNRVAHARSGWYEGGFFHNDNGDSWRATDMEVIAWMPLPEPYKAESEEQTE